MVVGVYCHRERKITSQLQDGGYWHCSTSFSDLGRRPMTARSRSGPCGGLEGQPYQFSPLA